MLSIYDAASAATALAQPLDPALRTLITDRLSDARAIGLGNLTHVLVVGPGDTEEAILQEIGWSPLVHPIDGTRFGTVEFLPYWSWLQDLSGWFELIHTVGNDGFAYIILVEDKAPSGELRCMCRTHVVEAGACSS